MSEMRKMTWDELAHENTTQKIEIGNLKYWVNDLHLGMYINCVYCGHRYGPDKDVPASMADVLKKHIEKCPKHPLYEANQEIEQLKKEKEWLLNYCLFLEYHPFPIVRNEEVEINILHQMQQSLKDQ